MAVTRIDITSRERLLGGKQFGATGAYDVLHGTVTCAVDPARPQNQGITDIAQAPRTTAGKVEWWADVTLLQPVDPTRGNRRLFFEVVNRGRILAFRLFDAVAETPDLSRPEHLGNAFLLQQGYTVAWCGWQWDVMRLQGLLGTGVPQAMAGDTPVSGQVLCQWWPTANTPVLLLADRLHHPYPAADVSDPEAVLSVREHENGPRQVIPRTQWRFARLDRGTPVPATTNILLETGFQAGKIYECVYRTRHAPVAGLGLLAVRDVVAHLKYEPDQALNPCAGQIDYAYGFGASQSGRFLRHFLYLGLNSDESGRMVFDGVMPHIAGARRGEFNRRFAQPSANTMQGPGTVFPFTDNEQVDPVTDQRDGLLRRLSSTGHCPKIIYTNTAAEYWRSDASLSHISVDGSSDVALPEMVRLYLFAGTQHTPGRLPLTDRASDGARGQYALNSVDYAPLLRAVLVHLDRWVSHATPPPPSRYPRLADGTAVPAESLAAVFQALPRGAFPSIIPQPYRLDFGPTWDQGIASSLPPRLGEPYTTFVSAVDKDGNEVAGIRLPDLTVPLATYTGWNPRHPSQGAPEQSLRMHGATIPFAPTPSVRAQSGDPRPSIAERYASKEVYLELVTKAAETLVAEGFLLATDVDGLVQHAARRYDLLTQQP
jgi:hypothetical protein